MKTLKNLTLFLILTALFFSCQTKPEIGTLLSNEETRKEIISAIAEDSVLSKEMMTALMNGKHGSMMMMHHSESMMKMMNEHPEMMKNMMSGMMEACKKDTSMMSSMCKMMMDDKEMMKKDLRAMTGVSTTTMSRLSKDENVSTEILSKICSALNCDVGDIMEFVPDKKEEQ